MADKSDLNRDELQLLNIAEVAVRAYKHGDTETAKAALRALKGKNVPDKDSAAIAAKSEDAMEKTLERDTDDRNAHGEKKALAGIKAGPFVKINYDPHPSSIDHKLTEALAKHMGMTRAKLIHSNRAVLKGGQKVHWEYGAEPEK